MAHIKLKQIHPQLRLLGSFLRLSAPFMRAELMPFMNGMQNIFMKGRWSGRFAKCETVEIPREDGTFLRLLICTPHDLKKEVPGLLWIHGGGYALGLPEQDVHFKRFKGCFHGFDIVSKRNEPVKEAVRFSSEVFAYAAQNYFVKQPEI